MENNAILNSQTVQKKENHVVEDVTMPQSGPKRSKSMYVLHLDGSRIFWLLSIFLLLMTFVLLLGYWIGSDSAMAEATTSRISSSNTITRTNAYNAQRSTNTNNQSSNSIVPQTQNQIQVTEQTNTANSNTQTNSNSNTNTQSSTRTAQSSRTTDRVESNMFNQAEADSRQASTQASTQTNTEETPSRRTTTRRRITRRLRLMRNSRSVDTTGSDRFMTRRKPYSIQIATHLSLRSALYVKKRLRKRRHPAYIFMHKNSNGKKYYKIRVGTFRNRSRAKKYLRKLKKISLGRSSIIIHR